LVGYEDLDDVDEHFEVHDEEVDDLRRNTQPSAANNHVGTLSNVSKNYLVVTLLRE
jgi:hypothetical protein